MLSVAASLVCMPKLCVDDHVVFAGAGLGDTEDRELRPDRTAEFVAFEAPLVADSGCAPSARTLKLCLSADLRLLIDRLPHDDRCPIAAATWGGATTDLSHAQCGRDRA